MPSKKTLVIVAMVVVFFIACAIDSNFGATLLLIYFFAGMFWLLVKACKAAKQKYSKKGHTMKASTSAQATRQSVPRQPTELWDDYAGDDAAYSYQNVGVFVPDTSIFSRPDVTEGALVTLRQEPENKYDGQAVAVVIGRKRIGYLYRGRLQDMANDWLDRGDSISGRISSVSPYSYDVKKDGIKIDLYFYE